MSEVNEGNILQPKCHIPSRKRRGALERVSSIAEKRYHYQLSGTPDEPPFYCFDVCQHASCELLLYMFMQIKINFFHKIYYRNLDSFSKTQEYLRYLSYFWANDKSIRAALGVKEVTETNLVALNNVD
jgi:hypothetical protein